MGAISIYLSATLLPQNLPHHLNNRCVSMSSSTVIKSQFSPARRRTSTGVPSLNGMTRNMQWTIVPMSVPVRVANELIQAGHHYVDVRTPEEFSDGHVIDAVNVPFMLRIGPGMARNPKFLEQVLSIFRQDDEIIVGCQLGKRSFSAASELVSVGFTGITDMAGGYAAWIQNGLPTTT